MRIYTGDSVTFSIPLRWRGGVFEPGEDWGLIFTAKNDPLDADDDAVIQKATGAGITVAGSSAAVEIVPQDTATLTTATLHCDIQAQEIATGEVRTVWTGELELRRDITRETTTSVEVYTTQPGYPSGAQEWNDLTGTANHIPFDTTPTIVPIGAGVVSWNTDDNTIDIQTGLGGVTLQVGQEQHIKARNNSGAAIANGSVVYLSGASGQRPTIALADADNDTHVASTIGLATADIGNNSFGMVTTSGLVRGVNTHGMTEGGPIYLSGTAGAFTQTAPTSNVVRVGWCIVAGNNGTVLVHVEKMSVKSADVTDASTGGNFASDSGKLVKFGSQGNAAFSSSSGEAVRAISDTGTCVSGISTSGVAGSFITVEGFAHCSFGDSATGQSWVLSDGSFAWRRGVYNGAITAATTLTASRTYTLGDWSGDIAGVTATQTLTNKTLDAPTITGAASFTSTTRPTSSGTGTPGATDLITRGDGDARFGGPIYDLDGAASHSETTTTTPIKTVVLPVGTYLIEFGRLIAGHTDATSRTIVCTINFLGGTATIQDRYVGYQGNQASPGGGVNFSGSGTSMSNVGTIGNTSPNFGSGAFPFAGRIVVTAQTTLQIFGHVSVTPTNPIAYETSGILRKIA